MADFNLEGLLGNIGSAFSGGGNYLDEYLTPEQRAAMQRNAMLAASAALLKAGGESTRRIGIGEALGGAFEAGQAGYEKAQTGALTQMALKQKLDEAKRAKELQRMVGGVFAPQAAAPTPEVDTNVPTGAGAAMQPAQVAARPMNPNAARANQYRQAAQMLNMAGQTEQAMKYEDLALKLDPTIAPSDKAKQLAELGLPPTLENFQLLESSPSEIKLLNKMGMAVNMANVTALKRAGAASTVVNMNEGQKGFENEMKLGAAFKGEPIYKDFNDMKSAYGQVMTSLDAGTPIGDIAGATKVMKLLDPGSVVRESELGIAMASAGRMDRLKNYFNNLMTGQKLTPTQRQDFKTLSNELYAVAGQAYNQKRSEYEQFGEQYKFPNLNTSLGAPANVPSIVKPPTQAGGSGLTWDPAQKKFVNR
jgi:tetratricopeptide (TPR) repeat protein